MPATSTADERRQRHADLLDQLTEGIRSLTTSEAWLDYLRMQARFHRYSFGNVVLIHRQRPDATRVAGFHAWKALGRSVKKGERGIRILAPVTYSRKAAEELEDGEPGRLLVGFRGAVVFDVSQTDGQELPEGPTRRLTGNAPTESRARLEDVATGFGFRVEDSELPGSRNGDCSFGERLIRVRMGLAPAQQVKTLAHELAHGILHEGADCREVAELEAESVAFIVCAEMGVDSSDYSFGYVASWAGGADEAISQIRESGERISRASRAILHRDGV